MNNLIYVMSCGCRLCIDDVVMAHNKKTCPNHPGARIIHREYPCPDCGKIRIVSPFGPTGRCHACQVERRIKMNRSELVPDGSVAALKSAQQQAAIDRSDCMFREECLITTSKNARTKYLPCYGCKKYCSLENYILGIRQDKKEAPCQTK